MKNHNDHDAAADYCGGGGVCCDAAGDIDAGVAGNDGRSVDGGGR